MDISTTLKRAFLNARMTHVRHRPYFILHRITLRCNCRCRICDWWKAEGYDPSRELDYQDMRSILHDAASFGVTTYSLWGGEPLMHPEVDKILALASSLDMYTTVCTNGTLLEERGPDIAPSLGLLLLSIDAVGEDHDKLKGFPGAFDRAMKGIESIRKKKKKLDVVLWSQLNKATMGGVEKVIRLADDLDVWVEFIPSWLVKGYNEDLVPERDAEYKASIDEIASLKLRGFPVANSFSSLNIFREGKPFRCNSPLFVISLEWDGRVQSCGKWFDRDYEWFGNLAQGKLEDLVSDPRYRDTVEGLVSCNDCLSVCAMHHKDNIFITRSEYLLEMAYARATKGIRRAIS